MPCMYVCLSKCHGKYILKRTQYRWDKGIDICARESKCMHSVYRTSNSSWAPPRRVCPQFANETSHSYVMSCKQQNSASFHAWDSLDTILGFEKLHGRVVAAWYIFLPRICTKSPKQIASIQRRTIWLKETNFLFPQISNPCEWVRTVIYRVNENIAIKISWRRCILYVWQCRSSLERTIIHRNALNCTKLTTRRPHLYIDHVHTHVHIPRRKNFMSTSALVYHVIMTIYFTI